MRAFLRFRRILSNDLRGASFGPIRVGLKQWAFVYRSFVQERFHTFSGGGGDWAPHAPSTIARRRKGRGQGQAALLRDTNTMFASLNPVFSGKPGAIEERIPFGVRVGFGGPARHPTGSATVSDIAGFHNEGVPGRLPKRQIIVPPDSATVARMVEVMELALAKTIKMAT